MEMIRPYKMVLFLVAFTLTACGQSEVDERMAKKKAAQAELKAWADKQAEFRKKHCQDPETDCQKLMQEAGIKKKGKDLL